MIDKIQELDIIAASDLGWFFDEILRSRLPVTIEELQELLIIFSKIASRLDPNVKAISAKDFQ